MTYFLNIILDLNFTVKCWPSQSVFFKRMPATTLPYIEIFLWELRMFLRQNMFEFVKKFCYRLRLIYTQVRFWINPTSLLKKKNISIL